MRKTPVEAFTSERGPSELLFPFRPAPYASVHPTPSWPPPCGGWMQLPQPGLFVDTKPCLSHDIPICWNVPLDHRYMFWAITGCMLLLLFQSTGWVPTLQAVVPTANAVMLNACPYAATSVRLLTVTSGPMDWAKTV